MRSDSTSPRRRRHRANDQGSIRQLPSGKYQWTVTVGQDADGKQMRQTGTCRTKSEAQRALNELLTAKQRGQLRRPTTITLGEYLETWLETRKPHLAAGTFEQYGYTLRHVPAELRRHRVQAITRTHLREFQAQLAHKGLSASVRSKALSYLRSALDLAVDDEVIMLNPAYGLRTTATVAERSPKKRKALTTTELREFLNAAQGNSAYALLYTMFSLGLRRGEALGLRWMDVDFSTGEIRIEQQVKLEHNRAVVGALKTVSSRRRLRASPDLLECLSDQRAAVEDAHDLADTAWSDWGLVFPSAVGTPLHPRNINRTIVQICTAAGLPRFSSHAARHTHITQRLKRGEKVEVVAATAGHANANVTLGTYRHVLEDELRDASFSLRAHLALSTPAPEELK